mgnify:CR=1 FL=1
MSSGGSSCSLAAVGTARYMGDIFYSSGGLCVHVPDWQDLQQQLRLEQGDIDKFNCSELVYKAYERSVNIDFDGDGGLGVYRIDILNGSETRTCQTIS